ncbi:flagellar hook-length control protein FliK [Planctomycetota bacterium]|nr:flagellar hook-length control protein FliK [Planctomycetota bacterium]
MNILLQTLDTRMSSKAKTIDRSSDSQQNNSDSDFQQSLEKVRQDSTAKNDQTSSSDTKEMNTKTDADSTKSEVATDEANTEETSVKTDESNQAQDDTEVVVPEDTNSEEQINNVDAGALVVQINMPAVEDQQNAQSEGIALNAQDLQNIVKGVFENAVGDVQVESSTEAAQTAELNQQLEGENVQVTEMQTEQNVDSVTVNTDEAVLQVGNTDQKTQKNNTVALNENTNTVVSGTEESIVIESNANDSANISKNHTDTSATTDDVVLEAKIAKGGSRYDVELQDVSEKTVDNKAAVVSEKVNVNVDARAQEVAAQGQFRVETQQVVNEKATQQIQLPSTGADSEHQNVARIERGLQSALNQNGGNVTLRLTPAEMGTVRINLQIQGTQVNVQMHAENESARSLLNQHVQQLRQSLEHQGLSVDRIGVQQMQNTSQSNMNSQSDMSQSDGRSRGEYSGNQQQNQQNDSQQERSQNFEDMFGDEIAA